MPVFDLTDSLAYPANDEFSAIIQQQDGTFTPTLTDDEACEEVFDNEGYDSADNPAPDYLRRCRAVVLTGRPCALTGAPGQPRIRQPPQLRSRPVRKTIVHQKAPTQNGRVLQRQAQPLRWLEQEI